MPRKAATPARDASAAKAAGNDGPMRPDASRDINVLVGKIKTMGIATHPQKINFIIAVSNQWVAEHRDATTFKQLMEVLFGDKWKALVQEARETGYRRRQQEREMARTGRVAVAAP